MSLLRRASLRYQRQHPWLLALSVLGVALGVAMVVAIDLGNASARRAFALSAETVAGRATHQVTGAAGTLPDSVYRQVRVALGVRAAAPVVEGYAQARGRTLQLLGVDPLAEAPFRPFVGRGSGIDLGAFLARPGAALLAEATAEALGVAPGDTFTVRVGGVVHGLRLAGRLEPADAQSARALESLLVVDVSTGQELMGRVGRLSRIDLAVPEGAAGEALLARLAEALPPEAAVGRAQGRSETLAQMTRAFNLNLTALSLLALVVGMFLIYNTMTFSVVQRRALLGRLRALGVSRREVFRLVLGEALGIGVVGTLVGLVLGVVLGGALVRLITQTINDLYFVLTVRTLTLAPLTLAKGVVLGLGATLVAALAPAREAAAAPPLTVLRRSFEETRAKSRAPALAALGVGLGAAGTALLLVPSRSIVLSYAALLLVLLGFALLTPLAVLIAARVLRPLAGRAFGLVGRMAARGIAATLSRTAVAIAALVVAIAATVGMGVMVDSFRATVATWLGYSLQADVYVQPPSLVVRRADAVLDTALVARLKATPGVAAAYSVRSVPAQTSAGATDLVAIDRGRRLDDTFRFKRGDPAAVWPRFERDDVVIVSEPFSYRYGLGVGDTLVVHTDRGRRPFAVVGVFFDYGSDLGVAMMSRARYDVYFDDRALSGLALTAAPGVAVDTLVDRLRARAGAEQEVFIRSNRALREASLEVFDRTFTVTVVLRLLAVLVAFVGVLSALMALQLERARELAVLRATGLTPRQVGGYVTLQTSLMGLVAGLLSLPLGLILATVLVYVINKRSFGWTLQFEVAPGILAQALVLALVAAVLAGLYPAWRMARTNPALALREE